VLESQELHTFQKLFSEFQKATGSASQPVASLQPKKSSEIKSALKSFFNRNKKAEATASVIEEEKDDDY